MDLFIIIFHSFSRIQYIRHLHEKVSTLETRTAPPKEEEANEAAAAAAMGYGMGGMMGNEMLMITNTPAGYGPGFAGGYGGPSSIPDPYAQPPNNMMGFGGAPGYGGAGYY